MLLSFGISLSMMSWFCIVLSEFFLFEFWQFDCNISLQGILLLQFFWCWCHFSCDLESVCLLFVHMSFLLLLFLLSLTTPNACTVVLYVISHKYYRFPTLSYSFFLLRIMSNEFHLIWLILCFLLNQVCLNSSEFFN